MFFTVSGQISAFPPIIRFLISVIIMAWIPGPACGVDCSLRSTLQAAMCASPARYLPSVLSLIASKKSQSWSEWLGQGWQWGHIQPFLRILGSVCSQTLLSTADKVLRLEGLPWAGVVWALNTQPVPAVWSWNFIFLLKGFAIRCGFLWLLRVSWQSSMPDLNNWGWMSKWQNT